MPVDTRHPDYQYHLNEWIEIRDAYAGEQTIKAKTQIYLPVPSGFDGGIQDERYRAYIRRARFPELVAPALRAIMGTLFRRAPTIDLPDQLQYLLQSATPEGLSLQELIQSIAEEVLLTGRCPLFVDKSERNEPAYLNLCKAEQLINWREETTDGVDLITLAVIESISTVADPEDEFLDKPLHEWLVFQLKDGAYIQRRFVRDENQSDATETTLVEPVRLGEKFSFIPMWIIGSTGTGVDFDIKPMLGISRLAVSIYQQHADYRQALYMSAQPTGVLTGVSQSDPDCPQTIGGGVLWVIANPDAKAEYLEFSGNGVEKQREAINDDFDRALQLGSVMITGSRRAAESGEALRIRQGIQTATLASIVDAIEDGLVGAIRFLAAWQNVDPDSIKIELNKDFVEDRLSGNELTAMVAAWQAGAFPRAILWNNLRRTEIIPQQFSDEDLEELMQEEGPSFAPRGIDVEAALMRVRNVETAQNQNQENEDQSDQDQEDETA